jgi:hypothetical protein
VFSLRLISNEDKSLQLIARLRSRRRGLRRSSSADRKVYDIFEESARDPGHRSG